MEYKIRISRLDNGYRATCAGRELGIFANPAVESARVLLAEGARLGDTLSAPATGDGPTIAAVSLARLVAPRRMVGAQRPDPLSVIGKVK